MTEETRDDSELGKELARSDLERIRQDAGRNAYGGHREPQSAR